MRTFSVITLSIITLLLASCSDKAKDFNGRWKLSTAPQTIYNYYWDFQALDDKTGIVTVLTEDTTTSQFDTCSTGEFRIKNKVLTIGAPFEFCQWHTFDGEWDLHEFNDEFLTVIRYLPRGTIYLEFIKQ